MGVQRTVVVACLVLVFGCSGNSFESESEELEYLTSISQPSVKQFRRKKELETKRHLEELRRAEEIDRQMRAELRDMDARQAAEEKALEPKRKAERAARAKQALVEAKEFENRFTPGTQWAAEYYKRLIVDYPGSPEADIAKKRIEEIEKSR